MEYLIGMAVGAALVLAVNFEVKRWRRRRARKVETGFRRRQRALSLPVENS